MVLVTPADLTSSTTQIQDKVSQTNGWMSVKFAVNNCGPQITNPNVFGDSLMFSLTSPSGQSLHYKRRIKF